MNIKTLVLGLGDTHHRDDGIGIHVINYLKKNNCIKNADIIDAGKIQTFPANAYSNIDRLIVVETAVFNSHPGAIKVFEGIEMDVFLSEEKNTCIHKSGLDHILSLTRPHGRLPAHRALVGIQPENLNEGSTPSKHVAKAIPKACHRVFQISSNWVV